MNKNMIKKLEKLHPAYGDVIIVTLPYGSGLTEFDTMKELLNQFFPGNDCILLPEGYSIRRS